jgi:diguanylate cyclase (GGDEF)-like protein
MPSPPSSNINAARPSVAALFGLGEDQDLAPRLTNRLRQIAAAWPFVLAAMVAVLAVIPLTMVLPGLSLTSDALIAFGCGGVLVVLLPSAARRFTPHGRTQCLALAALAMGLGMGWLLWAIASAPPAPARLACLFALAGAAGLSAVALQPVRIAALAQGIGMAASLGPLVGPGLPLMALGLVSAASILASMRLALIDRRIVLMHVAQASEGRFAAKIIAEFESHGSGWFWEADRHGRVVYLSAKVADELAQHGCGDVIGKTLTEIFRMDPGGTERTLAFHMSSRTSFSDYSVCPAGDTSGLRWWSMSGRPVIDDLGRFSGFIGSGTDLTEKRKSEAEITRLALFDGLTGLANRQRMRLSLDKTLAHAAGHHRPFALFLLDLDRFKQVNDTLGHQAGDALLKQVAQRLGRGVGDKGLVGRLGGDEFQVLLPGMDGRDELAHLARDLITSLSQPYFISNTSITIGCSIGVALAPVDGTDAETLVRNADLALYAAKGDGRGVHRFYAAEMLAGAQVRQQLEEDIRNALATGGFHLCYQAVVSTNDTRIVGYEALIRWDHPTRGLISPAEFIPVAEECGLIEPIGEWVLRTACRDAVTWPGDVRVAVNVSPIQFANPALPSLVTSALARAGLPPRRLELEITEGVFLDETSSSDAMFASLKGIGVRLALDDFGTGYSSLGYLRTAPFDKIKIDQSFVRGAAQPESRNGAIIKAIVTLAATLGMETTAEGVEVQDEIDLVRELGCSHIQGYVYGRPVPTEEVMIDLAAGGGFATARGFKISRSPRTRMLRSARIAIDGVEGEVRIRDISATGAMIDGIVIDGDVAGIDLLLELVEDQMFSAEVRWAGEGKVGVQFAERFDLSRLAAPPPARQLRRAG